MRSSRPVVPLVVVVFIACVGAGVAAVRTQSPPQGQTPAAGPFDLVAAEHGGRVEFVTSQNFSASGGGAAMNLIATTPRYYGTAHQYGWVANGKAPQDIVFSFFSQQTALVAGVLVNPMTPGNNDRPKDVEIWISIQSPTDGFTKVATATLTREDSLQSVPITPVEARFVRIRILTTTGPRETDTPGSFAIGAQRVKILEGERAGYSSILARNPELAALAKGIMPTAPPAATLPVPQADEPASCAVPRTEAPKPSTFPQSKQVLILAPKPDAYRTVAWRPWAGDTSNQQGRPVVPGVNYMWMPPSGAAPAHLIAEPKIDTVVLAQVCVLNDLSPAFQQALLAWVAAGHKLIIQDSDFCSGGYTPKYDFMPYPFATVNPGAFGAKGEAGVLENSTLASDNPKAKSFVDTEVWKAGPNDLGDSNVIVKYDARWCGAMWAKNRLQKNGMALAYARYGRGLIIYNGFDADQVNSRGYRQLATNELLQPFDGDHLPCSQPMGDFIVSASPDQKSQSMAADRTYTYPITVLGNFGYTGRVTLDASLIPADPAVTVKLDTTTADLTKVDEAGASLTVTAGAAASLTSKVISVRGRDAAGKTNVVCLNLPERRTGSVSIISGLRQDKPPTKNLEIILDASGSMKALLGKKTRWATAQDVLKDVVAKLPTDFSVGLRVYGHTLSSTNPNTCKDSALVVPVAPLNPASLLAAAAKLAPRGETPLVYSILQTPTDLKAGGGGTVILITDGQESCKGNFAAAAKALKDAGLNLTLNIVGFTLKNAPAQAALTGLAESTGGHYYGASNGDALARAVLLAAVDTLPYRILDAAGKEVARGEAGTDERHELAPGTYTVVVTAAEENVRVPITIALGQDMTLRALIKGDKLVVEK
jgi:von Willebrand factor type A domain